MHDPEGEGEWAPGGASRWWLHHSLVALGKEISQKGGRLVVRRGDSRKLLYWLATTAPDGSAELFFGPVKPVRSERDLSASRRTPRSYASGWWRWATSTGVTRTS